MNVKSLILFTSVVFSFAVLADDMEDAAEAYYMNDYSTAITLYEKLAEQGNAKAQFNLALIYDLGIWGIHDYDKAFFWYKKAAEQGIAEAQYNLAILYLNGLNSDKQDLKYNYTQAFHWFKKAAEQGDIKAQVNLGVMYKDGQGVKYDYAQAYDWFKKAAEQGDVKAQINLGELYQNGKGVNQDYIEALKWFIISSFNAKSLSTTHIHYIEKLMTSSQIELAQKLAHSWMQTHE